MNISKEQINNVDIDWFYGYQGINYEEMFGKAGKEHYRLLVYLSTLFTDKKIIDIGTHTGGSALALSYNNNKVYSNVVYSFDLIDKIDKSMRKRDNIIYFYDNLMDPKERKEWEDIILESPLIMLDIDPHNGVLEYQFYEFLRDNNYQGLLICDDIWYFKGMRDNFWYKIPTEYKTDITHLGHWSGTGAISFNNKYEWEDAIIPVENWTLVTAYFDLTKMKDASEEINNRPPSHYLHSANSTLSLDHNLVIFCEPENVDIIWSKRPQHLHNKTLIISQSFEDFPMTKYRDKIIENRKEHPYRFDNRNTASYYLFCMSRYAMLKQIIEENPFTSSHFAWINICIERMGYSNLIHLEEALSINRDRFSTCYIDYISPNLINNVKEYFAFGRCSMCSGFFTGNAEYMYKVCDLIEQKFLEFVEQGYGHADEQLYSPVYFENPDLFDWYLGDYFQMITNYNYVYEKPSAPINNLIRHSYEQKNWKVCYEACKKFWRSCLMGKTIIDDNLLEQFLNYYKEAIIQMKHSKLISEIEEYKKIR